MGTSWTYILFVNMGLNLWKMENMYVLGNMLFVWDFEYLLFSSISFLIICYEDEDRNMMTIAFIKSTQAWIWIAYLSKNMKWTFGKS